MKRRQGVATWWLPAAALVFGQRGKEEARDEAGLVQEKEERCGIGPVKKTREDLDRGRTRGWRRQKRGGGGG